MLQHQRQRQRRRPNLPPLLLRLTALGAASAVGCPPAFAVPGAGTHITAGRSASVPTGAHTRWPAGRRPGWLNRTLLLCRRCYRHRRCRRIRSRSRALGRALGRGGRLFLLSITVNDNYGSYGNDKTITDNNTFPLSTLILSWELPDSPFI